MRTHHEALSVDGLLLLRLQRPNYKRLARHSVFSRSVASSTHTSRYRRYPCTPNTPRTRFRQALGNSATPVLVLAARYCHIRTQDRVDTLRAPLKLSSRFPSDLEQRAFDRGYGVVSMRLMTKNHQYFLRCGGRWDRDSVCGEGMRRRQKRRPPENAHSLPQLP